MRWAGRVVHAGQRALVGRPEGKNYLEDPGVDGRIILKWTFKKCDWGGGHGLDLLQDRDRWRGLVNSVMYLRSSIRCGEFVDQLWRRLASEGLCFMELVGAVCVCYTVGVLRTCMRLALTRHHLHRTHSTGCNFLSFGER